MPRTLFCNSFEVGHNNEAFALVLKFESPEGRIIETIYVAISPSGTKTLVEQLQTDMKDYEKEHGPVEPWNTAKNSNSNNHKNNNPISA